jgi:hypothetical protein
VRRRWDAEPAWMRADAGSARRIFGRLEVVAALGRLRPPRRRTTGPPASGAACQRRADRLPVSADRLPARPLPPCRRPVTGRRRARRGATRGSHPLPQAKWPLPRCWCCVPERSGSNINSLYEMGDVPAHVKASRIPGRMGLSTASGVFDYAQGLADGPLRRAMGGTVAGRPVNVFAAHERVRNVVAGPPEILTKAGRQRVPSEPLEVYVSAEDGQLYVTAMHGQF